MKRILLVCFAIPVMNSCNETPSSQPSNEIYKIIVENGGCFGQCPIQAYSMDSTLMLKYCGYRFTEDSGCFTGSIDTATWNALNRKLNSINYLTMDTLWAQNTDDAPGYAIWIYHSQGIRKIRSANYYDFPDSIKVVFDWIENVALKTPKSPGGKIVFENLFSMPPAGMDTTFEFMEP